MKKVAALILTAAVLVLISSLALGQGIKYEVEKEYVIVIIDRDGTVSINYKVTIKVLEGEVRRYVRLGAPVPSYKVLYAKELETGATLAYKAYHGTESYVLMHPSRPIRAGESRTYLLGLRVYNFVYKDETNPGNAGLMFTPTWFDAPVRDLRVLVVLPPNATLSSVRNQPDYDNVVKYRGRLALYWERHNLEPGEKFTVGVSFPMKLVEHVAEAPPARSSGAVGLVDILSFLGTIGLVIVIFAIGVVFAVSASLKSIYRSPALMVEALGPRIGLTAVEAAYLLMEEEGKVDYSKLLTMVLYGLLRKGVVEIVSRDPLRLRVSELYKSYIEKRAPYRLRYYEKLFLKAIRDDGTLDPDQLAKVAAAIAATVRRKMFGFNRRQTIEYYRRIVARAWREVRSAKTPEVKLEKLEENLHWLMIDPDFPTTITVVLSDPTPVTIPPTSTLSHVVSQTGGPVPLVQVADSIASGIEQVSKNLVTNVEEFAKSVAEKIESMGGGGGGGRGEGPTAAGCVCACVACACACACVSCACACASGGVG